MNASILRFLTYAWAIAQQTTDWQILYHTKKYRFRLKAFVHCEAFQKSPAN